MGGAMDKSQRVQSIITSAELQLTQLLHRPVKIIAARQDSIDLDLNAHVKEVELHEILGVVCKEFGYLPEQIRGQNRKGPVVDVRHIATYLMGEFTTFGPSAIGREIERDHSTICANWLRTEGLIETNREFRHKYNKAKNAWIAYIENRDNEHHRQTN
jgi:chromosomal replication initiation ATPase DnaA